MTIKVALATSMSLIIVGSAPKNVLREQPRSTPPFWNVPSDLVVSTTWSTDTEGLGNVYNPRYSLGNPWLYVLKDS
jgi:hypothetical protein